MMCLKGFGKPNAFQAVVAQLSRENIQLLQK